MQRFINIVLQPDKACEMTKLHPGLEIQYQFKNIHADMYYRMKQHRAGQKISHSRDLATGLYYPDHVPIN